MLLSRNINS